MLDPSHSMDAALIFTETVYQCAIYYQSTLDLYITLLYIFVMKRQTQILVRVTLEEKEAFEECAKLAGTTISSWVRERLRLSAIQEMSRAGRIAQFLNPIPLVTGKQNDK